MCWRRLVFPFLNSRSFSFILNSCAGKVYYRSADRTLFTLLYHSVQSYLVSQFCFRKLFRKLFWKCRFIQLPALDMRSHPFTQPILALFFFSFFKVSFLIACLLTNALMKTTILDFGFYAKTPWMTSNVAELFLKTQRCHVIRVRTCLCFWVQQWLYGGKQTAEPSCWSFLLICNSYLVEECAPHLGHAVHANSRQCYFHILCAFPFTRKIKTCLPHFLIPCSKGIKSSLFKKTHKPSNQKNPHKTTKNPKPRT